MDKIRIDFFDILGYIVPGSALLMIGWIAADYKVKSIWQIYESVHGVDKKSIFMGLFLSYITGFALHILGSFLYDKYRNGFSFEKKQTQEEGISIQDKWTLIREFGEKHIPLLERWYALRALSQNLSAISLISVGISIYKWWVFCYYEWLLVAAFLFISFIVFMRQARVFHDVLNNDLNSVLNRLKLEDKSLSNIK